MSLVASFVIFDGILDASALRFLCFDYVENVKKFKISLIAIVLIRILTFSIVNRSTIMTMTTLICDDCAFSLSYFDAGLVEYLVKITESILDLHLRRVGNGVTSGGIRFYLHQILFRYILYIIYLYIHRSDGWKIRRQF